MPTPAQTAQNLKAIHLFRALLRETTYLPDSAARQYFRKYVVARFKAYQPAKNATVNRDTGRNIDNFRLKGYKRRKTSVITLRTPEKLRIGNKALNYLRRANHGEIHCLERVLMATYGRWGRRKHILMRPLLQPESSEEPGDDEPEAVAPLQQAYYSDKPYLSFFEAPKEKNGETQTKLSTRFPKLKAVLGAQKSAGGLGISSLAPTFPAKNIWQRPMPIKRARNIVKKWFNETMIKLLPPLPEEEFQRLEGLSAGKAKWDGVVRRRKPGINRFPPEPETEEQAQQTSNQIIHSGLWFEKPSPAVRPVGSVARGRPHAITPRFMRRIYAKIFDRSCMLEWDESRSKWMAIWGNTEAARSKIMPKLDMSLFSGVDQRGRLLKRAPKPAPQIYASP
jgi:hypothetical protein